jgi:hypothetical protein
MDAESDVNAALTHKLDHLGDRVLRLGGAETVTRNDNHVLRVGQPFDGLQNSLSWTQKARLHTCSTLVSVAVPTISLALPVPLLLVPIPPRITLINDRFMA